MKVIRLSHGIFYVLTAMSVMFFALFFAEGADAHMYFSFPSDSNPGAGDIYVDTAFAVDPPNADESGQGALKYDIEGSVYSSGNPEAAVPVSFTFTDNARRSPISVPGAATSVFVTSADYANDEPYEGVTFHLEFACYSKAFINLDSNGFSTRTFMRSGLEIVPLSDLAEVLPSSEVEVKILKCF
jgi:hypothetical protein